MQSRGKRKDSVFPLLPRWPKEHFRCDQLSRISATLSRKYLSSGSRDTSFQTRMICSNILGLRSKRLSSRASQPPPCSWPCRQNMTFMQWPQYILFLAGRKAMEKGQSVYSYSLWHPGSLASCCYHNTNNNFRCWCFQLTWSSSGIPSWRLTSKHY